MVMSADCIAVQVLQHSKIWPLGEHLMITVSLHGNTDLSGLFCMLIPSSTSLILCLYVSLNTPE